MTPRRAPLLALLLAAALPAAAPAQDAPPDPARPPATRADSLWLRPPGPPFPLVFGFRERGPMHHSLYLGWSWLQTRAPGPYGESSGPVVALEAGVGGVQASAGWASYGPHLGAGRWQASVLRTWGSPLWVEPDQTYLGAELRMSLYAVGVGFVGYRRISGDAPGDGWIGGATLVIGF
ncbi:MAG TPA: hypothetical protein VF746_15455 [Longimicrobium sp.]|jgi:hypothetical protein